MSEEEYPLDDKDRIHALEQLADRLGRERIPEAVADRLSSDLLSVAYSTEEEEYWKDVEREALKLLDVYYHAPGARPPGRGEERGAPDEVALELDENVTKRAEALAEVAATLCNKHPEVQWFRREYLSDRLLTDEEARSFLNARGGPHGTNKVARKNTPTRERLSVERRGPYRAPIDMVDLLRLADRLSTTYGWREGDALWFVLTGYVPPLRPLEVNIFVHTSAGSTRDYNPITARITVTAAPWINADEVDRAFRDAQRQLLGGDANPPADERTLEVVKFVARRMREHGEETWEARKNAWNVTCPDSWRYSTYRGFRQVYKKFVERYIYRPYNLPSYRPHERTPYEVYRADWNDRITGRKDRHSG